MEIADILKVVHPDVIKIAKELEKKGLIISENLFEDARKCNLKLSKKERFYYPNFKKFGRILKM